MSTTIFCWLNHSVAQAFVFDVAASSAAAAAAVLCCMLNAPSGVLMHRFDTLSLAFKLATCLSFNVAKAYGFHIMATFEGTGIHGWT